MSDAHGHRERLRVRFAKNCFEGFHDYEVLEYLLTYIFRQGDVKPVAKELIKTFGSFANVLDAPAEELARVRGMGAASAQALTAFRECMAYYFRDGISSGKSQLTKMSALVELLRAQMGHKQNEVLFAIFLNPKNEILSLKALGEGTVAQAAAYPRRIVEEALKWKATSIILAHNHPGGVAEPSDQDLAITKEIEKALATVEVTLQDHIILASGDYYSFKRNNQL